MKNKGQNKWLSLITIPFQMGLIIFVFNYLGAYLDERNSKNYFEKTITLLGIFLSMYYVIKQVNQINKEDK